MLVLTRKKNEGLVINYDIVITVVEIRGDRVRLGINCPRDCPVYRQEVHDALLGHPRSFTTDPQPRSMEEQAFLDAIREDPNDHSRRLVYADWLEERDDPLGEFIRIQCMKKEFDRRAHALWAEHGESWQAYLPPDLWK